MRRKIFCKVQFIEDIWKEKSMHTSINLKYLPKKILDIFGIYFKHLKELQHQFHTILLVPWAWERGKISSHSGLGTAVTSQHFAQLWVSTFTEVHCKQKLFSPRQRATWIKLLVPIWALMSLFHTPERFLVVIWFTILAWIFFCKFQILGKES